MTSPTVAVLRFEPPSTLMHWTRRAPELSATSRLVCIWIMTRYPSALARDAAFFFALGARALVAGAERGLALALRAGASASPALGDGCVPPNSATQRLRREIGRLSSMRSTSPALTRLFSSCAA